MVASYYAWDPEFDCITEETSAAGAITARYTHEPRPYGGLVSQRRGSATSYYHYDNVGTTRVLTDQAQLATLQTTYTAFGENVNTTGTTVNPFGYVGAAGYQMSFNNDVFDVRHRRYGAQTAKWLSKDVLFSTSHINYYKYANNSPLRFIDPSGHDFIALAHYYLAEPTTLRQSLTYHYSLEWWVCDCLTPSSVKVGVQIDYLTRHSRVTPISTFPYVAPIGSILKPREKHEHEDACKLWGSTELGGYDWHLYADVWPSEGAPIERIPLPLAVVYFNKGNHGPVDGIMPLIVGDYLTVEKKWNLIERTARTYSWAEQDETPPKLTNWPRSLYAAILTNSRTYIYQMVSEAQLPWLEMTPDKAAHPGLDFPSQNPPTLEYVIPHGRLVQPGNGNPGEPQAGRVPPISPR